MVGLLLSNNLTGSHSCLKIEQEPFRDVLSIGIFFFCSICNILGKIPIKQISIKNKHLFIKNIGENGPFKGWLR